MIMLGTRYVRQPQSMRPQKEHYGENGVQQRFFPQPQPQHRFPTIEHRMEFVSVTRFDFSLTTRSNDGAQYDNYGLDHIIIIGSSYG